MANTQEKQSSSKKSHPARIYHVDAVAFENGHFVGHDGFVVPKDFAEFYERFPEYVSNWVWKRLRRSACEAEVEDWSQELLMHLHSLPSGSKFRLVGKQDVVQTFDPVRMYGASEARFRSFINRCLANKFNTLYTKRKKEPLSNPRNLSLLAVETDEPMVISVEHCQEQSAHLRLKELKRCKQREDEMRLKEVLELADACDPGLRMMMEAFRTDGTWLKAARRLHCKSVECQSIPERLRTIGRLLLGGNSGAVGYPGTSTES
jgi:DNA-directed RNA polymerase specialized sigma24 family protein